MKLSEYWLNQWVNIEKLQIHNTLTILGLDVDNLINLKSKNCNFLVVHIFDILRDLNNSLFICHVDNGKNIPLQILSDANNIYNDAKVILGKKNTLLPFGKKSNKLNSNGIDSIGFFCYSNKIGIFNTKKNLLLLPKNSRIGLNKKRLFKLNNNLFNLKITSNRTDCISMLGIARELSMFNKKKLNIINIKINKKIKIKNRINLKIRNQNLCGRFISRIIKGVNLNINTPIWINAFLETYGIKNGLILDDISNYIMINLGVPSNIYDLNKLENELFIRWSNNGEIFKFSSNKTIDLESDVGMLSSKNNIKCLSGIAKNFELKNYNTSDIYIEIAFWWPDAVIGRTKKYKILSESGYRFERGIDFSNMLIALEKISKIIVSLCGGMMGPIDDQIISLPKRKILKMRLKRCYKLLGINIKINIINEIFKKLKIKFKFINKIYFTIPPSFRFDLRIEEDLIEEVARIYGFENISNKSLIFKSNIYLKSNISNNISKIRHFISNRDYQEVINFTFVKNSWERNLLKNYDPIKIKNPISNNFSVLRSSLIGGLLSNLYLNVNKGISRIRIFELGYVFKKDLKVNKSLFNVKGILQELMLSGLALGNVFEIQWGKKNVNVDFFDVKSDIESLFSYKSNMLNFIPGKHPSLHPYRNAKIFLNKDYIGIIGELHPKWKKKINLNSSPIIFELKAESIYRKINLNKVIEIYQHQFFYRDLSFWVSNSTKFQEISDTIKEIKYTIIELKILKNFKLFDVWSKKNSNRKSFTFRFFFQNRKLKNREYELFDYINIIIESLAIFHKLIQKY